MSSDFCGWKIRQLMGSNLSLAFNPGVVVIRPEAVEAAAASHLVYRGPLLRLAPLQELLIVIANHLNRRRVVGFSSFFYPLSPPPGTGATGSLAPIMSLSN